MGRTDTEAGKALSRRSFVKKLTGQGVAVHAISQPW